MAPDGVPANFTYVGSPVPDSGHNFSDPQPGLPTSPMAMASQPPAPIPVPVAPRAAAAARAP